MSEETSELSLPRRVYFGAEDRKHWSNKPIPESGSLHTVEMNRRQNLAELVIRRAEAVAAAVKTVRAFDVTGNTEHAIDHMQACMDDLVATHRNLVADIALAVSRYREQERTATDGTGPRFEADAPVEVLRLAPDVKITPEQAQSAKPAPRPRPSRVLGADGYFSGPRR